MTKLTRITLGSIDNLVDGSRVVEIGLGAIKGNCLKYHCLKLITSEETRRIKTSLGIPRSDKDVFLRYVNGVLNANKMYLAEVEYRASKWDGLFPHRLRGRFYREH